MISLFDVQCGFGGVRKGEREFVSAEQWLAEMDRLQIARAMVRIEPEDLDFDVERSNEHLLAACRADDRLVPCPIVLPSAGGDFPPESEQVERLVSCGAGGAWIRPAFDGWRLAQWNCGRLMEALAERRVPVFCLERMVNVGQLADLAGTYPRLPIILAGVDYRSQRVLVPLLEAFANIHLSIGLRFAPHRGIEQTVRAVGPERLLFGTGFPQGDPMMAITQLMYAEIPDEQKAMIGAGNIERIIGEIRR